MTTEPSVLSNALLSDGETVDLVIGNGRIERHLPAGSAPADEIIDDLGGMLTVGAFAEPHAHLDKALTADQVYNPTGDLHGAVDAWLEVRQHHTVAGIAERATAAIERSIAHGVTAVRSHVDVGPGIETRAVEALVGVRAALGSAVDLQLSTLGLPYSGDDPIGREFVLDSIDLGADGIGGVPNFEAEPDTMLQWVLDVAEATGSFVDLHVDETLEPEFTLIALAAARRERGSSGPAVTASHCVSLSMVEAGVQHEIAELVAEADISIVALPQTNLFLQARGVATAPPRGLTSIKALTDAGATVAAGGDNVEDPFNPMSRSDPLETASLLVTAGHLTPTQAFAAVSAEARRVMGLEAAGTAIGDIADLVAIDAKNLREAIARQPGTRRVYRAGRLISNMNHTVNTSV